jgi:GTP-binding protein HflX
VDKLSPEEVALVKDLKADRNIYASALTGSGLDKLAAAIEEILREQKVYIRQTFSYDKAGVVGMIHKYGEVLTEEYLDDGIFVEAYVPRSVSGKIDR